MSDNHRQFRSIRKALNQFCGRRGRCPYRLILHFPFCILSPSIFFLPLTYPFKKYYPIDLLFRKNAVD